MRNREHEVVGTSGTESPSALRPAVVLSMWIFVGVSSISCGGAEALDPVSPSRIEHTPVTGIGGVVFTSTPTPGPSPTTTVAPTVVSEPPEPLITAPGYAVGLFASDAGPVRTLEVAPNGDVFATVPDQDSIFVFPDRNRDGAADGRHMFFSGPGLNGPVGLAFEDDVLWVANTDGVVRFPYADGDLVATSGPELVFTLPGGGRNPERPLVIDPSGALYVGVGTPCNACIPTDPRSGTILRFETDGSSARLFAFGLRAPGGMAVDPRTGDVWLTDVARDDLGDDFPPDELNLLEPGANFGWPGCVGDRRPDRSLGGTDEGCAATRGPKITFPAHLGPRGLTFYPGDRLPQDHRDDLFVVASGSVARGIPIGYKLMRVAFEEGRPTGPVYDVVRGWLRPDTRRWGHPVDVEAAADGALLIADDVGRRIYRVFHTRPEPTATPLDG